MQNVLLYIGTQKMSPLPAQMGVTVYCCHGGQE